ncbi:NADP-dependent oxidoreductase [Streptomyces shenzhenensis]|uniref:NADP-dependent oxidoreductase n=1 Tax=Streptomyces shenzhenensis TaxID=943815 RepID=UPI003D8CFD48
MRAYEFTAYGGPEVMRLNERADPIAGPTEVVVDVHAAGLNPIDILQRTGTFRFVNPGRFPLVPGNEFSGTISAIGSSVTGLAVGDAVFARTDKARLGGLAEKVAIQSELVARMPRTVDFATASAVPLAGTTALQGITRGLAVVPGDRVLITAGTSMVGTLAIQLAAHAGAHVTTTASAHHTMELRRLGADEVLDYHQHPDHEIPGTYTKIFDLVPGADLRALLDRTQPGGRLLSVAATPTPGSMRHDYAMPAWRALTLETVLFLVTTPVRRHAKRRDVHYQRLSMRPDAEDLRTLADLIDSGRLHVPIDSRFTFDDAAAAFARVESRHAKGKGIVDVHRSEAGVSDQQQA